MYGLRHLVKMHYRCAESDHQAAQPSPADKTLHGTRRRAVEAEHALNKEIGRETGRWKDGVLVENGAGSVAAALQSRGIAPLCKAQA